LNSRGLTISGVKKLKYPRFFFFSTNSCLKYKLNGEGPSNLFAWPNPDNHDETLHAAASKNSIIPNFFRPRHFQSNCYSFLGFLREPSALRSRRLSADTCCRIAVDVWPLHIIFSRLIGDSLMEPNALNHLNWTRAILSFQFPCNSRLTLWRMNADPRRPASSSTFALLCLLEHQR